MQNEQGNQTRGITFLLSKKNDRISLFPRHVAPCHVPGFKFIKSIRMLVIDRWVILTATLLKQTWLSGYNV